ncbi:hypothetical protein [Chamaesiphon minutus]|nr:hypothetical protein [Chamaesiphon minutus]
MLKSGSVAGQLSQEPTTPVASRTTAQDGVAAQLKLGCFGYRCWQ